jgi:heme/copper-type cytochrome/quinol oxidase subunit 3
MSANATTARAAARLDRGRLALPNGWWGMLIFATSEATLFGVLIGSWFFLRFRAVHWPPPDIEAKAPGIPLILVGVLLTTSVWMHLASRAGSAGRRRSALALVLLALVVQSGYFAYEVHDFQTDLTKFTPQQSAYGSIYYTLLGADHAHVALGMLLSLWLVFRLARGLTSYRLVALRSITLYWHVVNAVTLAVIGTILSANV